MKTILLYASPLKDTANGSYSTAMGDAFLAEHLKHYPEAEILKIDLNQEKVGNLNINSNNFTNYFNDGLSDQYINLLQEYDNLIIATSMINFNVPAALKNFIDHIAVAGKTFRYKYDRSGDSEGLIKNLKVQILASQGATKGWYPWGDHVQYLVGTFNFLGAKVQEPILLAGTKTPDFDKNWQPQLLPKFAELAKF